MLVTLTDHQLEQLADLIAARVAPLDAEKEDGRLVDAQALGGLLGVDRRFVYQHADELGGLRLGEGSKPRLRFDPERARAAMARWSGSRSVSPNPSVDGAFEGERARGRRRLPDRQPKPGSILQLRGEDGSAGDQRRRGRPRSGDVRDAA